VTNTKNLPAIFFIPHERAILGIVRCGIPSLSSIVRTVIRKIDTFGSGTSSSEIRLKTTLPQFCDLNRAVKQAVTQYTSNCCLLAQCLYASSCDSTATRKTAAERKRDSRQNST